MLEHDFGSVLLEVGRVAVFEQDALDQYGEPGAAGFGDVSWLLVSFAAMSFFVFAADDAGIP